MIPPPAVLVLGRDLPESRALLARLCATGLVADAGACADPAEALACCERRRPAAVLLDLRRGDALSLLVAIGQASPRPVVALSPSPDAASRAVSAGAVDAIPLGSSDRAVAELLALMSQVPVIRRHGGRSTAPEPGAPRIAVVAASTGGPTAVRELLGELPAGFGVPILVAMHVQSGFTPALADWLGQGLALRVRSAADGDRPEPGAVLLAPDGHHLAATREGPLRAERATGPGPCPSADRLLASVAAAFGPRAFGAVLTGMGRDGAAGLLAVRRAGGVALAQDEASSVIFGMPAAALAMGAAHEALPPAAIGRRLAAWAQTA